MKNYIGCKIIKGKAMTYGEYKKIKYGNDTSFKSNLSEDTDGYMVIYPGIAGGKQHISWSPKYIFEMSYREIEQVEEDLINTSSEDLE
jgi:hypothetical protein